MDERGGHRIRLVHGVGFRVSEIGVSWSCIYLVSKDLEAVAVENFEFNRTFESCFGKMLCKVEHQLVYGCIKDEWFDEGVPSVEGSSQSNWKIFMIIVHFFMQK